MRRASLFIFFILTGTIAGMLVWQWKAYSDQTGRAEENAEPISQHITVESLPNELKIAQKVTGLIPGKEYRLTIPDTLFQWNCKGGNNKACDSADENPYTFFSNDTQMVFQYILPVKKNQTAFLLNNWTVSFPDVQVEQSIINISDSARRDGSWAAGIPLKAQKEMDLIDYYIFEGSGNTPALYWQEAPLVQAAKNGVAFYTGENQNYDFNFERLGPSGKHPFFSVVLTDQYRKSSGNGIMITGTDTKKEAIEKTLMVQFLKNKFGFPAADEGWLIDAIASYITQQKPGTEKGSILLKELKKELTGEELQSFFQYINSEAETLSTEKLDKFIGNLKGYSTRFFSVNKEENASFVPLYFHDNKKVSILGREQKKIKLLHKGGKEFFPFIDTMEALGFEVKTLSGQETMLLTKGNNSYRFYLNKNIFIYNEEDYGLLQNPLTLLNGIIYIEKQWLQSIFEVSIEEGEDEIQLTLL